MQQQIIDKEIDCWVIDAHAIAKDVGMGNRINTVMQPCFFQLAGVLPRGRGDREDQGVGGEGLRTTGRDRRRAELRGHRPLPRRAAPRWRCRRGSRATGRWRSPFPTAAPDFVKRVTARLIAGEGDLLPVSALPVDGTFPTGTAAYEKRAIAQEIPIWDPDICIDCGKCAIVCPHATIRMKVYEPERARRRARRRSSPSPSARRTSQGYQLTIQVAPDDCTGCGVCVDVCPAKSKTEVRHKAINMEPVLEHRDVERVELGLLPVDPAARPRPASRHDSVKGSQVLEPLFEFSGACAGCGETPYIKLVTQLFGDRMVVANATGCSSIYGANLPTTPYTTNREGRGPAWNNSLFEDNAEFGLGMRLGLEAQTELARPLAAAGWHRWSARTWPGRSSTPSRRPKPQIARPARARRPPRRRARRARRPRRPPPPGARRRRSSARACGSSAATAGPTTSASAGSTTCWHPGRNVNILVLDTEVYSNTGGQASKATPRGAVAKFAASGKGSAKKDLGAIARAYGNVYVAQIAVGANDIQTVKALLEADAWPGPSLVIAYSTCIAHGIDMSKSMSHQKDAVKSGYWPLYRFQPTEAEGRATLPARLAQAVDPGAATSSRPKPRFAILQRTHPERAAAWRRWSRPTSTSAGTTTSSSPPWSGPSPTSPTRASNPRSTATPGYRYDEDVTPHDRPAHRPTSASSCARRSWPRPAR